MSWRTPLARTSLLVMEVLWVYALVAVVAAAVGGEATPSLLGVGLIVGASYGIGRLLQNTDFDLGVMRLWGLLTSLLLFYAIVRVDFFGDWRFWDLGWAYSLAEKTFAAVEGQAAACITIPMLWLVWIRGVSRGQDPLMFEAVISSFATGVVILVLALILGEAANAPSLVGYLAVPYMALGLLAISLAHAARSELEYGRSFSLTWLAALGGAVLAMSLIALLFVAIDLGTMRDAIAAVALWVGRWLYLAFYAVTYVLAHAMQAVVHALLWALGADTDRLPPELEEGQLEPAGEQDPVNAELPDWIWILARIIGGLGIVGLAAAALFLTFTRYLKRPNPTAIKESTYSDGRLGADIGNLLGAMLGRLRPNLHFGAEADPVRRLYAEVLHEAAARGVERRPAQTPLELAPALDEAFTSLVPGRITAMFEDVRYGGRTPPPEQVQQLQDDWKAAR